MANLIEIVINAQDQASSVLSSLNGGLKNVGSSLTSTGVALTSLAAPMAAFFGTALKQASDQQAALSQLNQVIKSTGGVAGVTAEAANALSDSLSKVTRFSDDAILSGENMLLTFTNIGKDVFPQATKTVLDMSQALGQDMKSSAIQLGKALNDPIKGITALQRVGVSFTEAQKDQIKTLVESGNVMGAQKIILQELQREFGGSAEAAGTTFAGKMDILNHRFEEFQEQVGNLIMPMLERAMDTIGGVIDQVSAWAAQNPALVQGLAAVVGVMVVLGPILIGAGAAISALGTIIGTVVSGPFLLLIGAFAALKLAYDSNFLGFKDTVDGIMSNLGVLAGAVPVYLNTIKLYFDTILGNVWDAVGPGLTKIYDWFTQTALPAVVTFVTGTVLPGIQTLFDWLGGVWEAVRPALEAVANWFITDALPAVVDFIQNTALPGVQIIFEYLKTIWDLVGPVLGSLADWFLTDALPAIVDFINVTVMPVLKTIGDFLSGLWEKVKPGLQPLFDWFSTTFTKIGGFIDDVLKKLSDLKSQLATWQGISNNAQTIGQGLSSGQFSLGDVINAFVKAAAAEPVIGGTRDSGGPGVAGMPYLIGTGAQPELFMPSSSGTFIPNADHLGGKTITVDGGIHLHFPNVRDGIDLGNPEQVEAIAMAILDAFEQD